MQDAIGTTGQTTFSNTVRGFRGQDTGPKNFQIHAGVALSPTGSDPKKCDCKVNIDDAFDSSGEIGFGKGNVHPGCWDAPPGWTDIPGQMQRPNQPFGPGDAGPETLVHMNWPRR
jgi:hypothetical protein